MSSRVRRDKGSGSIYQRSSDGLWVGYVTLPDGPDRKRRRKVITARDRATVQRKLRDLRAELDRTGDLPTASPTLEAWLTQWLDRIAAPRLKPRTLDTYRGYVDRYLVPTIGRIRLDKLTAAHVRKVHDAVTGQGLSSTTALQAHRILAKALTDAVREGRVSRNVATLTDAPRKAVSTRGALTAEQARTLLVSVAADDYQAAAWSVALLGGLRQGERLGLTWDAVDLERGMLTISWQLQRLTWSHGCGARRKDETWPCGKVRGGSCPKREVHIPAGQEAEQVHGGLWLTRPKSRAGWRQVPMAPLLATVLSTYMDAHPAGMAGLVFADPKTGVPMDPSRDTALWDAALRAAGLPDVALHSARHTTATLLYELGVPERTRVLIMGHSSATTTAGYTHVADPLMRDAMDRLGALLSPALLEGAS
ncbi:tyrosine-type recombinase/integrase [Cellulomonas shaoxiangyii]|uniref:Site-specific integrase n=1 Tax=Cellulomonas shaoxiangyii TaxID=2566013 RepID=A0A4P7SHT8_9CELL|nr:site-specific integrase [Cellulomonas shaoxiangyii]QCB93281.1 site-specific integrase [Cellulomonas shaoxiangyii]TGY78648.1 site-specific integrase [Cellulomonas shaoxiangyii]